MHAYRSVAGLVEAITCFRPDVSSFVRSDAGLVRSITCFRSDVSSFRDRVIHALGLNEGAWILTSLLYSEYNAIGSRVILHLRVLLTYADVSRRMQTYADVC